RTSSAGCSPAKRAPPGTSCSPTPAPASTWRAEPLHWRRASDWRRTWWPAASRPGDSINSFRTRRRSGKMYLDRIVETKRREVEELRRETGLARLERAAAAAPPPRGFLAALKNRRRESVGLIAEVKKASPSKGLIRPDFDPRAIAR